jgi:hypothetical protein
VAAPKVRQGTLDTMLSLRKKILRGLDILKSSFNN